MSTMTADGVRATIESLDACSVLDPRERWIGAYRSLRAVNAEVPQHLKPYSWVKWLSAFVALAALVGLWDFRNVTPGSALHTVSLATAIFAIPVGVWLQRRLAARRHPLILLASRIDRATAPFSAIERHTAQDGVNVGS